LDVADVVCVRDGDVERGGQVFVLGGSTQSNAIFHFDPKTG